MDIRGSTALVTGGARGIGSALTRHLASQGAEIIIVGRNRERLEEIRSAVGPGVTAIQADLSRGDEVDRLISAIETRHPRLSLLINNAAMQTEMDLLSQKCCDWRQAARDEIAVNLEAALCLCIGLLPLLSRQSRAMIVNVGSGLAIEPKQESPVYSATKAGLRSFSKALRYQCAQNAPNVGVCHVVMALVDTDMTSGRGTGKITPARAAREIVAGIERNRSEIWVAKARLLRILHRLSPNLAAGILR